MPDYQPMQSAFYDDKARQLFSTTFFNTLFDSYRGNPHAFNSREYTQSRVVAQLATIADAFRRDRSLPHTVLDIGCGSVVGGDVRPYPAERLRDFQPWLGRALDAVALRPEFSDYHVDRYVGVDIGDADENFEFHSLDAFEPNSLDEVEGQFGLGITSMLFNSPALSQKMYGDYRNDGGDWKYSKPLMDRLAPELDKKLVRGAQGLVFYSFS